MRIQTYVGDPDITVKGSGLDRTAYCIFIVNGLFAASSRIRQPVVDYDHVDRAPSVCSETPAEKSKDLPKQADR